MAARVTKGLDARPRPVRGNPTIPTAIKPELIEALKQHAHRHRRALDPGDMLRDDGVSAPVRRVIGFAAEGSYTTEQSMKLLAALDQRHALRTLMLHQALRWLFAADQILTAPGDDGPGEIPF